MPPDSSFEKLMARLRAGDNDAATRVFQQFANRLIGLARVQLDTKIRQKVDAEDVVQSVFKSFFLRHADGQFELENWDSLWSLLVVITLRKCGREVKRFYGPHHDIRKESSPPPGKDDADPSWEAIAREPTPSEAASLAETVEQVMRSLVERERRILELRLQGYTVPEISEQVGRTEYTVEGVLKRIRKRLQGVLKEGES